AMILAPFEKVTYGQPCKKWDEAEAAGALDHKFIHEASGIAASRINKNRLYHVNDSGNGPYFYTTDEYGSDTKQIMIKDFNFKRADFEDMTIGPCYAKTCVFIADIGDNRRSRDFINILIIEEKEKYGQSEKPLRIVKLEYPDKPHNAESLAIHPNGDLYIITKEENYKRQKSFPSHIFRVKREKWEYAASKPLRLDHIGILDIESINPDTSGFFDN
ncbi:MAG: hypothetical protein GTN99_10250, partial [Candidatus Dadabacteria bacterium]|nr:hypothetical protein [Candidatus Dadabacteria bacterium]